jgi:hypothetical protein
MDGPDTVPARVATYGKRKPGTTAPLDDQKVI